MDFENLKQLLDDFVKLPKHSIQKKTFFDVSGYPHYENVCSNILGFFYDVSEQHGLNDLFIKSLIQCLPEDNRFETEYIETDVNREYENIDILIESDDHYIIIENKVFSGLHNDLKKYYSIIERIRQDESNDNKKIIPIVLSLRRNLEDYERAKIDKCKYFHVTYRNFFDKVRKNLGDYIEDADGEWIIFLKNFINNMSSLEGDNFMNSDFYEAFKFFDENYDTYFKLIETCKEIADYVKRDREAVQEIIEGELEGKFLCKFNTWNSRDYLASAMYSDFPDETKFKEFQVHRVLKGWEIMLRLRRKLDFDDTLIWLGEKGIHKDQNESLVNYKWSRITLWTSKTAENPNITAREVANEAIMLIKKIKE